MSDPWYGEKQPGEWVGQQVAALRKRRGWRQEDLVARLTERVGPRWRQSKIAKIERSEMKRLTVDEVFELAAALGTSPLYLITPDSGEGNVALGDKISRAPLEFRQWVRGYKPLFIERPEDKEREERFFFFESQPLYEWSAHRMNLDFADRLAEVLESRPKGEEGR